MRIADFKVRTRLMVGFGLLLITTAFLGGIGLMKLNTLHGTVNELVTDDWQTAKNSIGLRSNIRSLAARTMEFLLADDASKPAIREKLDEHRATIDATFETLSKYDTDSAEAQAGLEKVRTARNAVFAAADKVMQLDADPKTHAQAVETYLVEMRPVVESALADAQALVKHHEADFDGNTRLAKSGVQQRSRADPRDHGRGAGAGTVLGHLPGARHRQAAERGHARGRAHPRGPARQCHRSGR